jgi:hypothetical protein
MSGSALPNALSGRLSGLLPAAQAVLPAIEAAASRTGTSFEALFHTARLESGFNPQARARTSSATGLFQFIDSTWLGTLARHGPRHGIAPAGRAEALALRTDPAVASLMAAEHMADNGRTLERGLGRAAGPTDLYLAHFLGAGGALKFLSGMAADPGATAANLFPAAARANRAVFHAADGTARSLQQVHDFFARKLGLDSTAAPGRPNPVVTAEASVASPAPAPEAAGPTAEARRAAQAAYLLLAELGA